MSLLSHVIAALAGYVVGAARRPRVVIAPLVLPVERPAPEPEPPRGRTAELRARIAAREAPAAPVQRPIATPAAPLRKPAASAEVSARARREEIVAENRARAAALRAKHDLA